MPKVAGIELSKQQARWTMIGAIAAIATLAIAWSQRGKAASPVNNTLRGIMPVRPTPFAPNLGSFDPSQVGTGMMGGSFNSATFGRGTGPAPTPGVAVDPTVAALFGMVGQQQAGLAAVTAQLANAQNDPRGPMRSLPAFGGPVLSGPVSTPVAPPARADNSKPSPVVAPPAPIALPSNVYIVPPLPSAQPPLAAPAPTLPAVYQSPGAQIPGFPGSTAAVAYDPRFGLVDITKLPGYTLSGGGYWGPGQVNAPKPIVSPVVLPPIFTPGSS